VAAAEQEFDAWVDSSPEDVARSFRKLQSILDHESIRFDTKRLPATIKPYCMSASDEHDRSRASETTLAGISALGQLICKDDAALAMIGFTEPARNLLRLEPTDDTMPMCARADAFWTTTHGSFVEMNTDSPAMAVFSDVLQSSILDVLNEAGLQFLAGCRVFHRTDLLIDALVRRYRAHGGDKTHPMIAIVDWAGVKTSAEQRRLATAMTNRGYPADLFDPSELSYRDGRLYGRDVEIDLVHRRALFPEFLTRPDEVGPLLRAVRDGAVVVVNPLKAYISGNKGILALAHDPAFAGRLPKEQQDALARYVPYSVLVTDEARKMLASDDKAGWVIKSSFGSRGSEVILGSVASQEEWVAAIEGTRNGAWIAQRAVEISMFNLPVSDGMGWKLEPYWTNWNPWLIDGKYAGATVRCSLAQIISITNRGALAASISLSDS